MPWSASQQKRLALEKDLLERYFETLWSNWMKRVDNRVTCTNNTKYTLRIPGDYPSSCPQMVVSYPPYCLRKSRLDHQPLFDTRERRKSSLKEKQRNSNGFTPQWRPHLAKQRWRHANLSLQALREMTSDHERFGFVWGLWSSSPHWKLGTLSNRRFRWRRRRDNR